jgi:hypothetical protein
MGHDVRAAERRLDALMLAGSETFDLILLCDRFLPAYAQQLADEINVLAPKTMIVVLAGRTTPLPLRELETMLSNQAAGSKAA